MATSTNTMYRVTQIATGVAGSPYYMTAYFDASTSLPQACATAWRALLLPASTAYIAPYAFEAITEVDSVNPVDGDLIGVDSVTVAAVTCIGTGDPLPAATSLLLRWRTGEYVGGREIRGRTNVSRLSESDSSLGYPGSTLLSTWQTRLDTFLTTANVKHVVWSPKNGSWALTTASSPWGQWAVLRSRRD